MKKQIGIIYFLIAAALGTEALCGTPAIPDTTASPLLVEQIEIAGAKKTRKGVILRHLTFGTQDPINAEIIEENYHRLQKTNYFSKINFFTRPGSQKGRVIVELQVQERRWPTLHMEGGYSEFDGWYISPLSVRYDNVFGHGYNWTLKSFIGDRVGGISLGFWGRHILQSNVWVLAEVSGCSHEYLHNFPETTRVHKVDMGALRLDFGGHAGWFKYTTLRLQTRAVTPEKKVTDLESGKTLYEFPAIIARDTSKARIGSISLILSSDTRNSTDYPTTGFWGSISWESAATKPRTRYNYRKVIADGRFYTNPAKKHVVAVRLKYGITDEKTPFYDRFYLGGAMSLRGFEERSLTPLGWGTKLALWNLEYRIPLSHGGFPKHRWTAVLFFDGGGCWQTGQSIDYDDIHSSWGFGIRVRVPVLGLIRADIGIPLTREEGFFHVSLGHMF